MRRLLRRERGGRRFFVRVRIDSLRIGCALVEFAAHRLRA